MKRRETLFNELKDIYTILHSPKGCLWDKEQTFESILPCLQEEVDEFVEAVKSGDRDHMKEELGDVLLNVMFQAKLAEKEGSFDIEGVIEVLIEKIKRRHPHVFGEVKVGSSNEIIRNWNKIKETEKGRKHRNGKTKPV